MESGLLEQRETRKRGGDREGQGGPQVAPKMTICKQVGEGEGEGDREGGKEKGKEFSRTEGHNPPVKFLPHVQHNKREGKTKQTKKPDTLTHTHTHTKMRKETK